VSLKRANLLFWTGLLLYVASFFLVAVEKTGEGRRELRGYICAFDSFVWSSGGVLEIWAPFCPRGVHLGIPGLPITPNKRLGQSHIPAQCDFPALQAREFRYSHYRICGSAHYDSMVLGLFSL
jgi:hypothetical protein